MAALARRKSRIDVTEMRCLAATYVTIAAGAGLAALTLQGGWLPIATALLLPVFLAALLDAVRTGSGLWEQWRAHELGTNVKRALAVLGPAYRVVTQGSSLAEHDRFVTIGPNGIFLISSSDDGGRVTASDQRLFVNARLPWRNLVEDCRVEALRVSDRVQRALGRPVPVHAVLCFTRALVAVGQEIRGVKIVQVPRLARLIESVATATPLSEADVESVRTALVSQASVTPTRRVLRLTPRRTALHGERPLTLVGRPSRPQRILS